MEANPGDPLKHEKKWSRTPERGEQHRLQEQERRRKAKEKGRCRDCNNAGIPNQTRCESCANRHREYRRQAKERAGQRKIQTSG